MGVGEDEKRDTVVTEAVRVMEFQYVFEVAAKAEWQ